MSDDQQVEDAIQAKGLTAPRLTPDDIEAAIVSETFTTLPSGKVMVCELTLRNGFTVRGEAATVSKENFDQEIGQRISRDNARSKVWEMEGYLLQQRLHEVSPARKEGKAATDGDGLAFYQSHKQVHARPMTRGEYNTYRGWQIPADENPEDPGYLVVYNRGTEDHYESWSPKHVFDDGYTEVAD